MTRPGAHKIRSRAADGFTLVEMMVAVTLVAFIALLMWAVLRSTISSWKRGTDAIDASQRHRSLMDLMEKQVASLYPLIPPADAQLGIALMPFFIGSSSGMQFVTLSSFHFQERPGLTLVTYEVVRNDDGTCSLVEKETRYFGGDPAQAVSLVADDASPTTIFDNLESLEFEYFDPGSQQSPPKWVKEWDIKEQKRMPLAVSMNRVARDASGAAQGRQLVIPLVTKPENAQPNFVDPFEDQRRRIGADDPRIRR